MLDWTFIFLLLTATGLTFIVFLLLFKPQKESWDKIFIFLNLVLIWWIVSDIFYSRLEGNIYFRSILTYISALFLPAIYLMFIREFLTPRKNKLASSLLVFSLPIVLLFSLLYKPELMVKGIIPAFSFGPIFYLYTFYMVGYFGYSYLILVKKITEFKNVQQRQLKFIFYGSFISSIASISGALIFPLAGSYQLYFVSPAFILILSVFVTYAIFKQNLFNIKIIATELFVALLILVLLGNLFLVKGAREFFIQLIIFLAVSFFGILLIRSVLKEVKMRQKIEALAKNLEAANVELQKLDQAKSEFLNIASHQLRTPVSVIKGVASMMKEGDLERMPEEKRKVFIQGVWEKSFAVVDSEKWQCYFTINGGEIYE